MQLFIRVTRVPAVYFRSLWGKQIIGLLHDFSKYVTGKVGSWNNLGFPGFIWYELMVGWVMTK